MSNTNNSPIPSFEHCLEAFKFCPKCGAQAFEVNNEVSKKCTVCNFVYYSNPRGATVAIILNQKGEILVTKRAKNPGIGMLDMPGGFIDEMETAEEAVTREVKEETDLEVKSIKYLLSRPNTYLYSEVLYRTIDLFFECQVDTYEMSRQESEIEELMWVRPDELDLDKFAFESIKSGLEYYFKTRKQES